MLFETPLTAAARRGHPPGPLPSGQGQAGDPQRQGGGQAAPQPQGHPGPGAGPGHQQAVHHGGEQSRQGEVHRQQQRQQHRPGQEPPQEQQRPAAQQASQALLQEQPHQQQGKPAGGQLPGEAQGPRHPAAGTGALFFGGQRAPGPGGHLHRALPVPEADVHQLLGRLGLQLPQKGVRPVGQGPQAAAPCAGHQSQQAVQGEEQAAYSPQAQRQPQPEALPQPDGQQHQRGVTPHRPAPEGRCGRPSPAR